MRHSDAPDRPHRKVWNKQLISGNCSFQEQTEYGAAQDNVDDVALETDQRDGGAQRDGGRNPVEASGETRRPQHVVAEEQSQIQDDADQGRAEGREGFAVILDAGGGIEVGGQFFAVATFASSCARIRPMILLATA